MSQKPGTGAFQMKALTKAVKIGGRIVPSGAHIDSIRYVPPGTSLEDAMVESPEEFLYRLSRSRFGKGGVLRDAHGVLVLEFQRPDDPLDVQMELAELRSGCTTQWLANEAKSGVGQSYVHRKSQGLGLGRG